MVPLLLLVLTCAPAWPQHADFNGDGVVGFPDFFLFADVFAQPVDDSNRRFDLDNDGAIGFPDFFLFSDQFGKPIEPTFEGLAVARTDNPRVPIVAVHEEGTQIAILADESGTQIEGAVFTQEDGKSLHVLMGDDGLPERAHAEGDTFLFDNYQNNAVDVAVVAPDGTTEIYRNIAVDPEELEALTTVPSGKIVALQEEGLTLWKAVKVGLLAASVASCAIVGTDQIRVGIHGKRTRSC